MSLCPCVSYPGCLCAGPCSRPGPGLRVQQRSWPHRPHLHLAPVRLSARPPREERGGGEGKGRGGGLSTSPPTPAPPPLPQSRDRTLFRVAIRHLFSNLISSELYFPSLRKIIFHRSRPRPLPRAAAAASIYLRAEPGRAAARAGGARRAEEEWREEEEEDEEEEEQEEEEDEEKAQEAGPPRAPSRPGCPRRAPTRARCAALPPGAPSSALRVSALFARLSRCLSPSLHVPVSARLPVSVSLAVSPSLSLSSPGVSETTSPRPLGLCLPGALGISPYPPLRPGAPSPGRRGGHGCGIRTLNTSPWTGADAQSPERPAPPWTVAASPTFSSPRPPCRLSGPLVTGPDLPHSFPHPSDLPSEPHPLLSVSPRVSL
nr:ETS domain-containing transcription factor ERF-like isoform X1 [Macaca fascicularis]